MEAFARTGEAIRATSSKLEKTRLLGEYFATLDDETLPLAAVYFTARPFADRDQRKLSLGYAVIRNAAISFSTTPTGAAAVSKGDPALWRGALPVPACSQMIYSDGGRAWCSPTSTSMVVLLQIWMAHDSRQSKRWMPLMPPVMML